MSGREKARAFIDEFIGDYVDELRTLDRDQVSDDDLRHLGSLVTLLDRVDGKSVPAPPRPGVALIKK